MRNIMHLINPAEIKIIITALAGSFGLTTINGNLWQLIDNQNRFTPSTEELMK